VKVKGFFREKILVAGTLVNAKTIRIELPLTTLEQVENLTNALYIDILFKSIVL
jgi:hypothetical protein